MNKNVVIIGGGIIGLSTAYYLLKEGHKVTVIDKEAINSGASFVNAGYICPSHVIPLASPGMIAMGIGMMFNSASPFYFKPRLNIDLIKWAWEFNKASTQKNVDFGIPVIKDISVLSKSLFEEMKEATEFDFHYENKGLLMCYQSNKFKEKEAHLASVVRSQGFEVKHYSKEELSTIEPELNALGAYHYFYDSHSTPDQFMNNLKNYLSNKGVQFIVNQRVIEFGHQNKKVQTVITKNQSVLTDEVVIATGAYAPNLAKMLNFKLLVQAGKGYRINVKRETNIKYPAILTDVSTAVTPMKGFTRFGGTMEISGISTNLNKIRVQQIAKNATTFYPNVHINNNEIEKAESGLRPLSPDGLPFIGRVKNYENVCVATGHAMMGWTMGPATGKLISEVISNKQTTLNLQPFSLDRFN